MRKVLVFLLFALGNTQGDMRLLKRVDLSEYFHESRPVDELSARRVFAVEFSPNGGKVAFAAGFHDTDAGPIMHVIALDLPTLKQSYEATVAATYIVRLQWSTDSKLLLAQSPQGTWMLDSQSREFCRVGDASHRGGFVSEGSFAVVQNALSTTSIRFFDTRCKAISETILPVLARSFDSSAQDGVFAVAASRGDILLFRSPDWASFATILMPRDKAIWNPLAFEVRLFDSGKGVCAGERAAPRDATFRCWKVDGPTPRLISSWPSSRGGSEPTAAALNVPLVAFGDTGFALSRFNGRVSHPLRRWIIWDADRGRMVEQLPGKNQIGNLIGRVKEPYASALSADGQLFAIAGDGTLEIYELGTNAHSTSRTEATSQ